MVYVDVRRSDMNPTQLNHDDDACSAVSYIEPIVKTRELRQCRRHCFKVDMLRQIHYKFPANNEVRLQLQI